MLINDYLKIKEISINSIEPSAVQTTINGRDVVQKSPYQKWRIDVTTAVMTEREMLPLFAAITSQGGAYGEFQFKLPLGYNSPLNLPISVSAGAGVGIDEIQVATSPQIDIGSMVRFSGHNKVYQVIAHTPNRLTVYPALRENVTAGEVVTTSEPIMQVRLNGNMMPFSIGSNNLLQSYDLSLVEVI